MALWHEGTYWRRQQDHHEINDNLTRAMIRDFATAVSLNHRDIMRRQHVRLIGTQPQRKYRRMFDNPEFIGRIGITRVSKGAHRIEGLLIRLSATLQNDGRSGSRGAVLHRPLV